MTVSAEALRKLHRIHRQISDLRSRLDRGPRQLKASEIHAQQLHEKYAATKESFKHIRMSADDKQLQLRHREDRIKDLQGKLNSCSNNREYQTLREQIAADAQANSVLSDEILEALERMDQQQILLVQQEQECTKIDADLVSIRARVEQQQVQLQAELERVTQDLHQAERALPAEIRQDYDRIARARGEDALAPVDGEVCSGCYQVLSPQTMNSLMLGKAQFCKSCGALLYLAEDTSPMA